MIVTRDGLAPLSGWKLYLTLSSRPGATTGVDAKCSRPASVGRSTWPFCLATPSLSSRMTCSVPEGMYCGWAEAFLNARFGGFLAPLWPVFDDDASNVVAEFFEHGVKNKQPIGEVVRGIRARHKDASATFLSYIYYGDVMARFA